VTHCHIMEHFDMFVTLKVFKLIGPSNDGRRHGRGTYLFALELLFFTLESLFFTLESLFFTLDAAAWKKVIPAWKKVISAWKKYFFSSWPAWKKVDLAKTSFKWSYCSPCMFQINRLSCWRSLAICPNTWIYAGYSTIWLTILQNWIWNHFGTILRFLKSHWNMGILFEIWFSKCPWKSNLKSFKIMFSQLQNT
jgi:hypothetical protein